MYTAYFDESGTHAASKALIVAGYVASSEQWVSFEREWRDLLSDANLSGLHMRDFNPSVREFASWRGDRARRDDLRKRVIKVIRKNVRRGFAAAVIMDDYRRIDAKYRMTECFFQPYPLAALNCVNKGEKWRTERGYQDPIQYVFEDGVKGKGVIADALRAFILSPPSFKKKSEALPFQIADFASNQLHKQLTRLLTGIKGAERDYFPELNSIPNDYSVWEETYLENYCQRKGVPLRG